MRNSELALRNLLRNTRFYAAYFFSLVANIAVYYLFTAVRTNPAIASLIADNSNFASPFTVASVIIAVFAGIFMWYSASFFQRRRGREFALYGLFGMSRTRIGALVSVENLILGTAALVAGLALGILFSKLFFMALLYLIDARVDAGPAIDGAAILQTVGLFLVLNVAATLASLTVLARSSIAELFKTPQKAEPRLKTRPIVAIIFASILVAAYVLALSTDKDNLAPNFLIVTITVIVATLGFLAFFLPYVVEKLRNNTAFAWKGGRLLALGHLAHRMRKNVATFFVIAIAGTVSIAAFGAVLNYRVNNGELAERTLPGSISYRYADTDLDSRVDRVLNTYPEHRVLYDWQVESLAVYIRFADTAGLSPVNLLSVSEYRRVYSLRTGGAPVLPGENTVYVGPGARAEANEHKVFDLVLPEHRFDGPDTARISAIRFDDAVPLPWSPANRMGGGYFLAIADKLYERLRAENTGLVVHDRALTVSDEYHIEGLQRDLENVLLPRNGLSTRAALIGRTIVFLNLLLFVGSFVCLIFICSAASVIHFKLLMDAQEDRGRYGVARAIGFDKGTAASTVRLQVLPLYLVPGLMFCAHGAVALLTMLRVFRFEQWGPTLLTLCGFALVFAVFCTLSTRAYRREVGL